MASTTTSLAPAEALALRMSSLLLRESAVIQPPTDVAGVVTWFGAMQSQDAASGLWSLGARLPGHTRDDVLAALERREALRTWPMRGTVHLVPSRDAHWMLELMGSRTMAGAARRRASLGLDDETAERAVTVLGEALAGGGRLTRAQCLAALTDAGLAVTGQLGYHLLWYASQRGVTCIAPAVDGEQTFVLLDEWVPDPHRPSRDEALATIATRYFRGHGPTTRQDFAGWTGLTATDAKRGIAAAGPALAPVRVDGVEMFADPVLLDSPDARVWPGRERVRVLPGFDEYLLGFKDRSLMVAAEHLPAIVPGNNGVFQPTLTRAGRVIGTWKRSTGKASITVRVFPLAPIETGAPDVERAFEDYARFIGQPVRLRWPDEHVNRSAGLPV